jgi:acetolactate synthase-1/3 small subunit
MTIVTEDESTAPERTFEQIRKQLSKMIDTVRVKALSPDECVSRELVLMKILKTDGVLELCEKLKVKTAEVTDETVMVQIADTPEEVIRICNEFEDFNILETVRTGVISLQKGSALII